MITHSARFKFLAPAGAWRYATLVVIAGLRSFRLTLNTEVVVDELNARISELAEV
jgi:hypothetical protein